MNADLKNFVTVYAKTKGLPENEVAMFAGALSKNVIEQLDAYKEFVLTLNQVAPQLIQLNLVLGNNNGWIN